jgi:uncharacterized protein YciU (UPF0263 family)
MNLCIGEEWEEAGKAEVEDRAEEWEEDVEMEEECKEWVAEDAAA